MARLSDSKQFLQKILPDIEKVRTEHYVAMLKLEQGIKQIIEDIEIAEREKEEQEMWGVVN